MAKLRETKKELEEEKEIPIERGQVNQEEIWDGVPYCVSRVNLFMTIDNPGEEQQVRDMAQPLNYRTPRYTLISIEEIQFEFIHIFCIFRCDVNFKFCIKGCIKTEVVYKEKRNEMIKVK